MNPLNKILIGLGAAVALVIVIVILWLSLANAHLRVALAESQANGTACALANDEFRTATARQNAALLAIKNAGEAREKQIAEALKNAEARAARYHADAEHLAKKKSSGDACKAAETLLNTYVGATR